MLDFLRSLDVISRTSRTLVKSINAAIDEYFNEHEDEPSDEFLAKKLGEDVEKIRDARGVSSIITLLPLDDQIELSGGGDTFERVEKEDLIEKIERILQKFNEREQLIIQLYYYEELSSKEISEILQVSESRISQIHKRLLEKIRENLGA